MTPTPMLGRKMVEDYLNWERKGNGGAKTSEEDKISKSEKSQGIRMRGKRQHGQMADHHKVASSRKQSGSQDNRRSLCIQKSHIGCCHHYGVKKGCRHQLLPTQQRIIQHMNVFAWSFAKLIVDTMLIINPKQSIGNSIHQMTAVKSTGMWIGWRWTTHPYFTTLAIVRTVMEMTG